MAELTDKELDILNEEIERGGLTYTELQKELLDHLCCDIEVKMDEGIEFIRALEELKGEMGLNCFRQIQEDTLLLINQKYRMMKKFMYILGSIAPTFVIVGTFLKTQHLPGASVLMVAGLFLLAAIYLPVFISIKIRDTRKDGKRVNIGMYIIGMISGIIFILGAMFKIMHWPGAGIMISLAALVTVLVFIPMLVFNAVKDKVNQVQNFTILIFVLSFVAIIFMSFALSVSKSVMDSFDLTLEDNVNTIEVLHNNNKVLTDKIENSSSSMSAQAMELTNRVDRLSTYIDETMRTIVLAAHDINAESIDSNGNIDFSSLVKKDDNNTPAYIMIVGIDNDVARGEVIKSMMEELKTFIAGLENDQFKVMSEKLLETSPWEGEEYTIPWVSRNFEHLPMMSVLVQLTNIQENSRILEGEVLRYYLESGNLEQDTE